VSKRKLLILILVIIVAISAIGSFVARTIFFADKLEQSVTVSLVGPMSGKEAQTGLSMRRGAELFAEQFNLSGGLNGKGINLDIRDDANSTVESTKIAQQIVAEKKARAVVGHWRQDLQGAVAGLYSADQLPFITISANDSATLMKNEDMFGAQYDLAQESKFLANYTRNVLGKKIVTIIHDDSSYGTIAQSNFEEVYLRFGTKIRYTHSFEAQSQKLDQQLMTIVEELKSKKDAGTLFLATRAPAAAKLVDLIRKAGIRSQIVGLNVMASQTFLKVLNELPGDPALKPKYTDGIIATSPLLFDTASQQTQEFKNNYVKRYGEQPDWIAANAFESLQLIVAGLAEKTVHEKTVEEEVSVSRQNIQDYLSNLKKPGKEFTGVTGITSFKSSGESLKPIQIGVFNGQDIVAAMTQLQPLSDGSPSNYFDEIKKGRMLYVNDKFMYKTNVVYTGLQLENISDLDTTKRVANIEFALWFRYRGDFKPEEVIFPNAVEPIVLTKPEEAFKDGDISFKLYRIKGLFNLDFLGGKQRYGYHTIGLSFRHKDLDRNNLLYVVDILGMDLNKGETLLSKIQNSSVISPTLGWGVKKASVSQELFTTSALGKPIYVGFGSLDPEYSRINLGALIQEDKLHATDFIPAEYFIYIGIFGFVGMLFAWGIDRKTKDFFWATSSWVLRCIFWPVSMLAVGNIALDLSVAYLSYYYTTLISQGYDMMWWIIGASLGSIALERFLWSPLEKRTEKKIPDVIRLFASTAIYLLAVFGIVAFVFGETLTSLLATGGLFTMIIGLAVQSNIANVFSGIVVNIERPFTVGDWIKIDGMDDTEVLDITWRTTRLRTMAGLMISLPNARVAEATTINYARNNIRRDVEINVSTEILPEKVCSILQDILDGDEELNRVAAPFVVYKGVNMVYGQNVNTFKLGVWRDEYGTSFAIMGPLWHKIWETFKAHDISFIPPEGERVIPKQYLEQAS